METWLGAQLAWVRVRQILWSVPPLAQRSYGICRRIWSAKWNGPHQTITRNVPYPTDSRIAGARVRMKLLAARVLSKANVWWWLMTLLRGTPRRIVQFWKKASEVHVAIGSPKASLSMFLWDWYPDASGVGLRPIIQSKRLSQIIGDSLTYLRLMAWFRF